MISNNTGDMLSEEKLNSNANERLSFLKSSYITNSSLEKNQKQLKNFSDVIKVDNHIHAASSMTSGHLSKFIKESFQKNPDKIVLEENGKKNSFMEFLNSINVNISDVTAESLQTHADENCFENFKHFKSLFNLMREPRLRDLFLRTNNKVKGEFFAGLLKEVAANLKQK